MIKTNLKFMSDFDLEVANKSISSIEAAAIYYALIELEVHLIKKDDPNYFTYDKTKNWNYLLDKLQKIMESQ